MSTRALILLAVFLSVALLLLGLAAWTLSEEARHQRRLRARVRRLAGDELDDRPSISLLRESYLQNLSPLERRLELSDILQPLRKQLDQAGVSRPAYQLLLLMFALGLGAALLTWQLVELPLAAPLSGLLVGSLPLVLLQVRKQRRMQQVEQELPDVLSMLARSLRAGLPLTQALKIVADDMDGVVPAEFGIVYTDLNYGGEIRAALDGLSERVPSPTIATLNTAIMIQRDTGGNLAHVIDQLENLARQRFRFKRQLKTFTASNRVAAWIVGFMPFALAAILELTSPGYITDFFDTEIGRLLIYTALGLVILGALVLWRLVKVEV
ncbi:MAG: type II secretion system F family protein [Lamprobacter sp.]|uniref:type II secretion system F family protein n=1 Tax=Lamprobacter sp. TaxID=3100796 RepID=UPI002B2638B6|nr:type II secretion system F family protein [Lamprobacter sp.]MEA3640845.1 type II secretion system F family protein [Lamprobacter sp.]